jgi:hypothetical protein
MTPDELWIPIVAQAGWLILTRDQQIRQRAAEIKAVMDHGARMVAIVASPAKAKLDNFDILEVFMVHWRKIEPLTALPGPFVYTVSRPSGLRKVA